MEEIHVWLTLDGAPKDIAVTYEDTVARIERGDQVVHTTQTHFISFRYKAAISVHVFGEEHEFCPGHMEGIDRVIEDYSNIEKFVLSGQFEWYNPGSVK